MGAFRLMDETPDYIGQLKLYGVFKEATRLVQKQSCLFLAILSAFYTPYIFINLLLLLCLAPYSLELWHLWNHHPAAGSVSIPFPQFLLFIILCRILSVALSLFLLTATASAVAEIYSTGAASFASVVEQLPRLWPRVAITFLWSSSILLLFQLSSAAIITFIYNLLRDLGISSASFFAACLLGIVASCVLYVEMLWLLSLVIPAVEESTGRDALVRSSYLILGKKFVAFSFIIIFELLRVIAVALMQAWIIRYTYDYVVVKILVLLLLLLTSGIASLYGHVMLSVLYFSAKAYHEEHFLPEFTEGYGLMKAVSAAKPSETTEI